MKIYILIIFILIFSCSLDNNDLIVKQTILDDNDFAVFGVLSDVHGDVSRVEHFLNVFKNYDVEYVILPGDIAEHFRKTSNMLSDEEQIYQVLKIVSEFNKTVFVIPGNHDSKEAYYNAISRLNKSNIIDGSQTRYFNGNNFNLVFVPGYFIPSMTVNNGFVFNEKDIELIKPVITKQTIIVSHSPPKFTTKNAIDVVYDGKNVGSDLLTSLIKEKNISFGIFGHIHEVGGKAVNLKEQIISQNFWSDELFLNPSSVIPWTLLNGTSHNGTAGILWFKEGKAKYKILN